MKPILLSFFSLLLATSQLNAQGEITWADDVACIIYNNCTKCHHPGGIAPISFMSYEDVYEKRGAVSLYVEARVMPPSPALPGDVPFRDDNILSEEEIETIVNWVLDGAPSGDLAMAPPAPDIPEGEVILLPDASFQIDTYASQAENSDDYRCFAFETSFPEDKWVTGVEVVPGNKSIVHHVILYEDDSHVVVNLDESDPLPGYTCFGGVGSNSANFVGGWVPGQSPQFVPDGMGLLIPQNTNLIIQTHYPEDSEGMLDSTKVNLTFAENGTGLRQLHVTPYINHFTSLTNGPLFIPANTTKTMYAQATVVANVSLTGVLPHMHLLGKSMYCYAVIPAGDTIELFDIAHWDFEWQLSYQYKKPIHLPFGSKIYAEAVYDNTPSNPNNPSSPPVDVFAGEATTDEMFIIFFSYVIYQAGDENLVFEDGPPFSDACENILAVEPTESANSVRVSPNPANHAVMIETPWEEFRVSLHDLYGKTVVQSYNLTQLQTSTLPDGIYVLLIEHESDTFSQKIIITH